MQWKVRGHLQKAVKCLGDSYRLLCRWSPATMQMVVLLQVMWWCRGHRSWFPAENYILPNLLRHSILTSKRLEQESDRRLDIHINSSLTQFTLNRNVSEDELQIMAYHLNIIARKYRMTISSTKTKSMALQGTTYRG